MFASGNTTLIPSSQWSFESSSFSGLCTSTYFKKKHHAYKYMEMTYIHLYRSYVYTLTNRAPANIQPSNGGCKAQDLVQRISLLEIHAHRWCPRPSPFRGEDHRGKKSRGTGTHEQNFRDIHRYIMLHLHYITSQITNLNNVSKKSRTYHSE